MRHLTTTEDVLAWLADPQRGPATFLAVDLTGLTADFTSASLDGSTFLGCPMQRALKLQILDQHGTCIEEPRDFPSTLRAFRKTLYTVPDLYAGLNPDGTGWEGTPDFAGFHWFMDTLERVPLPLSISQTISAVLHDTIQEALVKAFLKGRNVVAIMGGHDARRRPPRDARDVYWECVVLAKRLTENGFFVLTGGGPGLMEAGNLGALLAGASDTRLDEVRAMLPDADYGSTEWRASARAARSAILGEWKNAPSPGQMSLGIPTWHYGHEPPNLFASHHAKMFYNSLREDGLVTLANSGIIFFDGNAGTVQEIFQDATQNYYLGKGQSPTPMVFFNADGYWDRKPDDQFWPSAIPANRKKPLLPLVRQLALEKNFIRSVFVTDRIGDIVTFLTRAAQQREVRKADLTIGNALVNHGHNI